MKCIWCGKEAIGMPLVMFGQRAGDTYICASCGYHWDNYGKSYSSDWKPDKESLWNKIKKFFNQHIVKKDQKLNQKLTRVK